jgi:glycosyltransferase 2 family protein
MRRLAPKLAISIVLGALFAFLAARSGVPTVPPGGAFASVTWWAVPAYAASLLLTHFLRAARWRHLIAPVKSLALRDVVLLNWVGFFAIFALPLRLGEVVRPALTKLRHGIPLSAGFGTVAAERVIDGLVTSLCVAWAVLALPHLETRDPIAASVPWVGAFAVAGFSCAFAALGLFLWKRELAVRFAARALGRTTLASTLASKVDSVADGLRSLSDRRLFTAFVLETCLYWFSNAAGMWLLAIGCGLPATIGHGVAVMGILALGILLPAGPGLFGSFQLAIASGLRLYFPESTVGSEGAVYIFLMYSVQAVAITLTGALPLYFIDVRIRDLLRTPEDAANLAGEEPAT